MRGFRDLVIERFRDDVAAWQRVGWDVGGDPRRILPTLIRYAGLRATLVHRLAFWAATAGVPALPTLLSQFNLAFHGIELPPRVPIGPGLYMPHTTGSVISAHSIGSNVTLQGGITVGMRRGRDFPTVGDGVVLSAGCRVLGAISVGADAVVGANAVVIDDVAAGAMVVGVPARPLPRRDGVAAAAG